MKAELIIPRSCDIELLHAAQKGNIQQIDRLIDTEGANVNFKSSGTLNIVICPRDTPLIVAAKSGKAECVERLIEHRANLEDVDNAGHTALMNAALDGQLDCLKALIKAGSNIQQVDGDRRTALSLACWSRYDVKADMVRHLLEHGAKVDHKDAYQYTPLMSAFESWVDSDIVACFLEFKPDILDVEGDKLIEIAKSFKNQSMIDLIVSHREDKMLLGSIDKDKGDHEQLLF